MVLRNSAFLRYVNPLYTRFRPPFRFRIISIWTSSAKVERKEKAVSVRPYLWLYNSKFIENTGLFLLNSIYFLSHFFFDQNIVNITMWLACVHFFLISPHRRSTFRYCGQHGPTPTDFIRFGTVRVTLDAGWRFTIRIQDQTAFALILGTSNATPIVATIFAIEEIVEDQQWVAALAEDVLHPIVCQDGNK
jgi:hypothetical protein